MFPQQQLLYPWSSLLRRQFKLILFQMDTINQDCTYLALAHFLESLALFQSSNDMRMQGNVYFHL